MSVKRQRWVRVGKRAENKTETSCDKKRKEKQERLNHEMKMHKKGVNKNN